ncbi:hypothetical protein NC998_23205 [Trichocoleus desertorum GB2-A4]|uniref:Uncharacterized protein n=1 Tax=Trichocoleus desertorum GB2-A4 TaxID=2933944 RepID=A0ABV0JE04_9CYAN|nr:hypothetical protein [Trichocoleus sp. FACHB-46]
MGDWIEKESRERSQLLHSCDRFSLDMGATTSSCNQSCFLHASTDCKQVIPCDWTTIYWFKFLNVLHDPPTEAIALLSLCPLSRAIALPLRCPSVPYEDPFKYPCCC